MSEPLSEAKQTLLRALESIEELEQDSGAEVQHIAVVYAVWKDEGEDVIRDYSGWNHSTAPTWLIAALLREGAESIEASVRPAADDDED